MSWNKAEDARVRRLELLQQYPHPQYVADAIYRLTQKLCMRSLVEYEGPKRKSYREEDIDKLQVIIKELILFADEEWAGSITLNPAREQASDQGAKEA